MSGDTVNTINSMPWTFQPNYQLGAGSNYLSSGVGIPNYSLNMPTNWMDSSMVSPLANMGNLSGGFDFNNILGNYNFRNIFGPSYYPNSYAGGSTAEDDRKARKKDIEKYNKEIKTETEKVEKLKPIKENNEKKLKEMTKSDEKEFGFKGWMKGAWNGLKNSTIGLVCDRDENGKHHFNWKKAAITAGVVGLAIGADILTGGALTPLLLYGGAAIGLKQTAEGAINYSNAKTYAEKERAVEGITEGAFTAITSAFGGEAALSAGRAAKAAKIAGEVDRLSTQGKLAQSEFETLNELSTTLKSTAKTKFTKFTNTGKYNKALKELKALTKDEEHLQGLHEIASAKRNKLVFTKRNPLGDKLGNEFKNVIANDGTIPTDLLDMLNAIQNSANKEEIIQNIDSAKALLTGLKNETYYSKLKLLLIKAENKVNVPLNLEVNPIELAKNTLENVKSTKHALKIDPALSMITTNSIIQSIESDKMKEKLDEKIAFQQELVNKSSSSIENSNEQIDKDVKALAEFYKIDTDDYDRKTILEKIETAKAKEFEKTRNETEG